jgi:hypothetical protein
VVGARAEPHIPGLGGVATLVVADHADSLVGQVFGQVVALRGQVGLINVVVVFDQIREPLVGLPAQETVETVEALLQRPRAFIPAGAQILLGYVMILAHPEGAPASILQQMSRGGALVGDAGVTAGETIRSFSDFGEAVDVVVPAG